MELNCSVEGRESMGEREREGGRKMMVKCS